MSVSLTYAQSYRKVEKKLEGGKHWRCKTPKGPLHLWVPAGYNRAQAGVVVYVHGYAVNADQAWDSFKLAEQFRKSRQNALFVVPEAPTHKDDHVSWPELSELRKAIRKCNLRIPNRSWIIIGHSAAYRTVREWVDYRSVAQIILLDALYSGQEEFKSFVENPKGKKLILVSTETSESSRSFVKQFPYAVRLKKIPEEFEKLTRNQKRAKLLYIKSQFSHHNMIASQKVIPLILRVSPLKLLPEPQ